MLPIEERVLPFTGEFIDDLFHSGDPDTHRANEKTKVIESISQILENVTPDVKLPNHYKPSRIIPRKASKNLDAWLVPEWARRILFNITFDDPNKFKSLKGVGKVTIDRLRESREHLVLTSDFYPICYRIAVPYRRLRDFSPVERSFSECSYFLRNPQVANVCSGITSGRLLEQKVAYKGNAIQEIRKKLMELNSVYMSISDDDTKDIAKQYIVGTLESMA